ncbi:MAG: hypothetical protein Q9221_008651 [Calogaya cf. arnoldii]
MSQTYYDQGGSSLEYGDEEDSFPEYHEEEGSPEEHDNQESSGYSYIDDRDHNWLGHRTLEALHSHTDKIRTNITYNVGGWEAWTQVELMYALTKATETAADSCRTENPFQTVSSDFRREERYPDSDLRSDFTIEASCGDFKELHSVELKCRTSKETNSDFVNRVKADIDKIHKIPWYNWTPPVNMFSVWVVAISIDGRKDGDLDKKMRDMASKKTVDWHEINLTEDGAMKIWTYCQYPTANYCPSSRSLFSWMRVMVHVEEYN